MSDIKMSDLFSSVTYREKTSSILNGEESIALLTGDHEIGNAIVHAINNHDRLTEENAQLKADNAELVKALEMAMDKLDSASFQLISNPNHSTWEMGQLMALMAELLQKHKEPNNA